MVPYFYSTHNNLCISQAISFYKVNEFKITVDFQPLKIEKFIDIIVVENKFNTFDIKTF